MSLIVLAAFAFQTAAPVDPLRLHIGTPGEVTLKPGEMRNTRTLADANASDVAKAADGAQFVLLGEEHDNKAHHQRQADIIEALAATDRPVIVGFEMFTRPVQDELNPWTLGWWNEDEFITRSDWKKQWGFDYALYRPIFETVKKNKLPMVALNVPRDWVRTAGKTGYDSLSEDVRAQVVPSLDLGNENHKAVFNAMMGGHPLGMGSNIYSGQVLWDTGMADTAIRYLGAHHTPPNTVFVIVAGAGHVMYGQGINYRLGQRHAGKCLNVVMVSGANGAVTVSRGIGDFVYAG